MFSANNFSDFIRSRPPLVVFTICLVALAISTFSLAFYIQHTTNIPNSDVKENWSNLKKHFNTLEACIESKKSVVELGQIKALADTHTVYTFASLTNQNVSLFTYIQGSLILEGWKPYCPVEVQRPEFLKVIFNPLNNTTRNNLTQFCVGITGPKQFLPEFSVPACFIDRPLGDKIGVITTSILPVKEHFCENGTRTKIQFNMTFEEHYSVFLESEDVTVIYMHLMWCSYILVLVLISILLYAIFHKTKNNINDM